MAKKETPKATSAFRKIPSLKEDVVKGVKEDVGRVSKARSTTAKGAAKQAVTSGAKRAAGRLAIRGGLAGTALSLGLIAGDRIRKSIPTGKDSRTRSGNADKIPGQGFKSDRTKQPSTETKIATKTTPQRKPETPSRNGISETRKEFNKTFRAARNAGKSKFTFRNKSFNTKLK